MKSPNVLLWFFPSAECSHIDRVRHAGNVWLKLADYGISQVSTGFVMRVRNKPVGTPGYMAPELFDQAGQQVSSVKVSLDTDIIYIHTYAYTCLTVIVMLLNNSNLTRSGTLSMETG